MSHGAAVNPDGPSTGFYGNLSSTKGKIMARKLWVVCHKNNGEPVVPIDCNDSITDEGMLVYKTKAGAKSSADHQNEMYDLDTEAVPLASLNWDRNLTK